jgi:hypothetical protein
MRASIFVITFAIGTATALPALAQQTTSPDRQIQTDKQMQEEADKGIKTRDSGQSGFVGAQERPGTSAHAPGQPKPAGQTTTGSSTSSSPR